MDVKDSENGGGPVSSEVGSVKPHRPGALGVWSLSGAAVLLAISVALLPIIAPSPDDGYHLSKWEAFAGNMHFLVLHLPIGLFVWVFILEILGLLSFGKYRPPTALPLFFGVVFGVIAVILGYYLYLQEDGTTDLLTRHMWGSVVFVVLGSLSYMTKISALRAGTRSPVYAVLLCATMGAMGLATHWGGESVHGNLFRVLSEPGPGKPEEGQPVAPPVLAGPVEDLLAYEQVVTSIIDSKCLKCHTTAEGKRPKGKLALDSYEGMLKGGSEAPALVPGSLEDSLMITRIHIPVDDDPDEEHMPPADKDQLSKGEIAVLEWWVKAGAPKETSLKDAGAPEDVIAAADEIVAVLRTAPVEVKPGVEPPKVDEEAARREALKKSVAALKEKFGGALNFVSQDSSDLNFNAVGIRKDFGDEGLAALADVGEAIVELDLSGSAVTDAGMASLSSMPHLKKLRLKDTGITDAGLVPLKDLPELEFLVLFNTPVTDAGMEHLKAVPSLKELFVGSTQVTEAGVKALQEAKPELEINTGL